MTAAVTGTTIIVTATRDGGFKFLVLEGHGKATSHGHTVVLNAGQLVFVLPRGQGFSPVVNFLLQRQAKGSNLVGGFDKPLDSKDKIDHEIKKQKDKIGTGDLVETSYRITDDGGNDQGVSVVDDQILQIVGGGDKIAQLVAAFAKDVTVANATFDPNQLFDSSYFAAGAALLGQTASGYNSNDLAYLGHNINITVTNLNLSQFSGVGEFTFVASGNLTLPGTFTAVKGPGRLSFDSVGTLTAGSVTYNGSLRLSGTPLNIASYSTLSANGELEIDSSNAPLTLFYVNLINSEPVNTGGTDIWGDSQISITGGNFSDTNHIGVDSNGAATVSSANFNSGGDVSFNINGLFTLTGTTVNTTSLNLSSSMDMSITSSTLSGSNDVQMYAGAGNLTIANSTISGSSNVQMSAPSRITITGSTFSNVANAYGNIGISATEIVMSNVALPDTNIGLYTTNGNWSTISPVPGGVYFTNTSYAGTTLTGNGSAGVIMTSGTSHTLTSNIR